MLTTRFDFTLPRGFLDSEGNLHRQGTMRLATAKDEVIVHKNKAAQDNEVSAAIIMLSQVITQLGDLAQVTPELLENLFSRDLAYLREFYNRVNQQGNAQIETQCPHCNHGFSTEFIMAGESLATLQNSSMER
jgi:Phage tail assembly chaperone proteins, E, or 41 or 14